MHPNVSYALHRAGLPEDPAAAFKANAAKAIEAIAESSKRQHDVLSEDLIPFVEEHLEERPTYAFALLARLQRFDLVERHFGRAPGGAINALYERQNPTSEVLLALTERHLDADPWAAFNVFLTQGRPDLVERHFERWPGDAIHALRYADPSVVGPTLVGLAERHIEARTDSVFHFFAVLGRGDLIEAHFERAPVAAIDALYEESHRRRDMATPGVLACVERHLEAKPGNAFSLFHNLADKTGRNPEMMDRFQRHFGRAPSQAIDALYYVCANSPALLRAGLIDELCAHMPANPAYAFQALQYVLARRPELVTARVVERVIENLHGQLNLAFGLIREIVKARPEFMPLCTMAFFECVVSETRPFIQREMLEDIVSITALSHVKTALEEALREPPSVGGRRARVLMAILFRQKFRSRQRVLLDALLHATQWPSLWDFLMFALEGGDPKSVSSADAERFLEAAYRLSLIVTGYEYGEIFVHKLDFSEAPDAPFPPAAAFLNDDAALRELHKRVSHVARQFGVPLPIAPIERFRARAEAMREELAAIRAKPSTPALEARARNLEERIVRSTAGATTPQERRDLLKKTRDALRAAALRVALGVIEQATNDAYRAALRHVLGRDVDISRVEPAVLPALMYFESVRGMRANSTCLARLIEDRIEGRLHDWLRTEPPVDGWAERIRKAAPGVRLERWRAPFEATFDHRSEEARTEKQRRIDQDLAQTRALLQRVKADVAPDAPYETLREAYLKLATNPETDPHVLEEVANNLSRIRIALNAPDSDYEGRITLTVEDDPFRILFMGEYGFASCLSVRGSNTWSAVSNAIDIDKTIVWARDAAENIVARRLIRLAPEGIVSYRTYTNRPGLSLDAIFDRFVADYAKHVGVGQARGLKGGPLLSDRWYDDGPL